MKAIVCRGYGSPDVLELQDVDKPVVKDNDVLVRIHAASVNPYDWHSLTGRPYLLRLGALRRPKRTIPGVDAAGRVEAVGRNVTQFQPGDEVFGGTGGAYAEYVWAFDPRKPSRGALKNPIRPRLAAPVPMREGGPCSVR